MRIISDFHDYYDKVYAYSASNEILYKRKEKEVEIKKVSYGQLRWSDNLFDDETAYIGFCGKIYPVVKLKLNLRGYNGYYDPSYYFYDWPACENYLKENLERKYWDKSHGNWKQTQSFFSLRGWFKTALPNMAKNLEYLCKEYENDPVFWADVHGWDWKHRKPTLVVGPISGFGFQQVFNPYLAYLEIEKWLSNVAAPPRPIPEISNNDLIEAKGFDLKTSFRGK